MTDPRSRTAPTPAGLETSDPPGTRASLVALLIDNGLMSIGFYMLIPLLSVQFTSHYGMSAATVGIVLAVRQFTQQGLMIFGGAIGDRWGHRWTISGGFLVRALGFVWFAYARDVGSLVGAAVVTGLGGALFEASGKAALAELVAPDRRVRLFSFASLIASVGSAVGPLIGVALLNVDFLWVGLLSSACFFLASGLSFALLPSSGSTPSAHSAQSMVGALVGVVRDGHFVRFTIVMSGYWFVANQMYLSVPIHINRLTGDVALVGTAFATQAVLAMGLQVPLVRLVCRVVSPLMAISFGILLMGLGLGAFLMATDGYGILACVIVFGIGRLLVEPVRDAVTAGLAAPGSSAAYFGFGYLSLAFGGSLGNWVGGRLMDLAVEPGLGPAPWVVFCAVGVGSAIGMAVLARTPATRRPGSTSPIE